ncbi:radical SAM protein [Pseudodesulfovibrio sediminis]|uniref:Radical SAM protein n=1 Tax=Pseudodesulfovibrio sediminis TaxID=2810563 RepID=A0ABN6ESD4_9BACT|nr:radical SAM protein [Pseudodesulfovibrio sediminis]BCS88387.1 radical SAM protein [Pseudodesulfovibrio sediminis]
MDARYYPNIKQMNSIFNEELAKGNVPTSICFPEEVTITTTLRCNYRCTMCYQKHFDKDIDPKVYEQLEPILPFVDRLQIFGGEPLMYSHITDIYEQAHRNQCKITMISNGSLLTDSMCEAIVKNSVFHIKFSIDGGSQETYKKIRGGNFFKVMKGIANITQNKIKYDSPFPDMHFNFLQMRSNMAELPQLISMASDIGVSSINVFYPSCHTKELIEESVFFCQEESDRWLRRSRTIAAQLGVNLRLPPLFSEGPTDQSGTNNRFCSDPWTKLLIDLDGTANLCCGGPTNIGNLLDQSFDELWNCEKAQKIRATVNTPNEPAYCRNCRVRKPIPTEIDLHIRNKQLQEYALKRFGMRATSAAE